MDKQEITIQLKKLLAQTQSFAQTTWVRFQNIEYTRKEWLLVFGLAMVVGIGCKAIAINTITIGYEDYKIMANSSSVTPQLLNKSFPQGPLCEE
ncbi:MAG: hypothetical protein AAB845_02460 [Patescibacteria group bacterium]